MTRATTAPCVSRPVSTATAPSQSNHINPRLISAKVIGLSSAEIFPDNTWIASSAALASPNSCCSFSSSPKALVTRTPVSAERVFDVTWSRLPCTFLYIGMVRRMITYTTRDSSNTVTPKVTVALLSMEIAMITAPATTKGERSNKRRNMFTPPCSVLISEVSLVTNVEVPSVSISV